MRTGDRTRQGRSTRGPARSVAGAALTGFVALTLAGPVAAQQRPGGLFDQPYQSSPFAALVPGVASLVIGSSGQIGNNTLNLGDLVAIHRLSGRFRFNDLFLIGGLIPDGEGLQGDAFADARIAAFIPVTERLDIGFRVGAIGHANLSMPEELATLVRDGVSCAPLEVDLTRFRFSTLGYSEVGGLAVFELPAEHLPPSVQLRLGGGVRYLRGIGFDEINFDADDGAAAASRYRLSAAQSDPTDDVSSTVVVSHDGITADVTTSVPLGLTPSPGGHGYALDLMVSANMGRVYVGATAIGIGRVTVRRGRRAVGRMTYEGTSVQEFLNALDAMPRDTLDASPEIVTLPRTLRLETSVELRPDLLVGAAFEHYSGDLIAPGRSLNTMAEVRPRPWLPLRLGVLAYQGFSPALQGGVGLDLDAVRFESELVVRGGVLPDRYSRAHLRAGVSVPLSSPRR